MPRNPKKTNILVYGLKLAMTDGSRNKNLALAHGPVCLDSGGSRSQPTASYFMHAEGFPFSLKSLKRKNQGAR